MNISGAEAVVAASSPWVGQGESACLVRPYVDCTSSLPDPKSPADTPTLVMTESELRQYSFFNSHLSSDELQKIWR